MDNIQTVDVLIIGAGPSGIALAKNILHSNECKLIVLEKGDVANSWKNMPNHLRTITYWNSNYLLDVDRTKFASFKDNSAIDMANYLRDISQGVNILENEEVINFQKENNLIEVQTLSKRIQAKVVVNATGYYSTPLFHRAYNSNSQIKQIHFKDFKNSTQVESFKNILIVGKRLSAGQVIKEIAHLDSKISLSVRSKVKYGASESVLNFCLRYLSLIDFFTSLFIGKKKLEVHMDRSVEKYINSSVTIRPDIREITSKEVKYVDGNKDEIDLIIYCTGFEYGLAHLPEGAFTNTVESRTIENLFFIGREGLISFKSRFLRGIRDDAKKISELVVNRLRDLQ